MDLTEEIVLLTENIHWLTKDQAWYYRVLPESKTIHHFSLFCEEGADQLTLSSELEILLGLPVKLNPLPAVRVARLLSKYYIKDNAAQGSIHLQINHHEDDFL